MSDTILSSFSWSVADLLRGDYKQSEYGKVILPFTVLRRLDCVLEMRQAIVLADYVKRLQATITTTVISALVAVQNDVCDRASREAA